MTYKEARTAEENIYVPENIYQHNADKWQMEIVCKYGQKGETRASGSALLYIWRFVSMYANLCSQQAQNQWQILNFNAGKQENFQNQMTKNT